MRMFNFNTFNLLFVHVTLWTSLIYSIANFWAWNPFFEKTHDTEILKNTQLLANQWMNDTVDCHIYQVQQDSSDFVPVLQCQWNHPGIATYAPPMFADVDGDGKTEIVVLLEHSPDGFAIVNPETCEAEHIVAVGEEIWLKDGGIALGDVDHNGIADIFIPAGTRLQRWQYNPITMQVEKVWETAYNVTPGERAHLDILDIDQDGVPEIIPNIGQMVNALTGEVYPGTLPMLHQQGKGLFAFSADAIPGPSPAGQSIVELLYGTYIYRYDYNVSAWVEIRQLPNYFWGSDACVAIADMDLDGDVDAVITNYLEAGPGEALIWDLQTDEILGGTTAWNYPSRKGSRMMIANMDDDPYPEMAMTSRFTMFAVDDIVTTGSFGNVIWLDVTTDESGHTELTSFDFDGDGKYEITYRDETHLRVFNGMGTGIPTGEYPSSADVLLNSDQLFNSCSSFTGMEYPTIGDVDNDDEAEMVTTCHDLLNIFKSGSLPWRDATQVWNTNAFNVTCVNQDGTIPAVPIENYTLHNNFLSQVTLNPIGDTLAIAIPDAYIHIVNAQNQCGETLTIEMEICNQGEADMPAGMPIAIYIGDPRETVATLIQTSNLTNDLTIGNCTTKTVEAAGQNSSNLHLFAVVNDFGNYPLPYVLDAVENGGVFPITEIVECDYTNNLSDSLFIYNYGAASTIEGLICENDTFFVHQTAYTEAGIYETILTAEDGCDSLVTLILEVLERGISTQLAEICSGENYEFANQFYTNSGTYYDTIPLPDGCDSLVRLDLTILANATSFTAATICEGETYTFNENSYQEAGFYHDTLWNAALNGCDSIISLGLNIVEASQTVFDITICDGESYTFADTVRTISGTYIEQLLSYYGCDSLVTLNLNVMTNIETNLDTTICEGRVFWFGNQTYGETGIYEEQFTSSLGCDSLVTLTLTVVPHFEQVINATICQGDSYSFAGYEYAEQGSFEKYYIAQNGCDSIVTLNLYLENPAYEEEHITICEGESHLFGDIMLTEFGVYHDTFTMVSSGCDSFVWMHIYTIPSFENALQSTICEGESVEWNDSIYTISGIYEQVYTAANGCDSTLILDLNVLPTAETEMAVNICEGETYTSNGSTYEEAGFYTDTLTTVNGCDSILNLNLFILPEQFVNLDRTICEGETYQIGNTTYADSGFYIETLTAKNGCDSIVELILTVFPTVNTALSHTMCEGENYSFEDAVLTETGFYTQTLTAANGCDSILNLNLQVLPIITQEMTVSLCEGEEIAIGDETYNEAGFYENTFTSSNGCDSIVALTLSVFPEYETTNFANICDGETYSFGALILTEAGFYTENFTSIHGCDSVVHLQLFVLPAQSYVEEIIICEGESIQIGGFTYNESGDYLHTLQGINACDSVVNIVLDVLPVFETILNESICTGESYLFDNQNLITSGVYQATMTASNGCDSLVVLNLNIIEQTNTSLEASICEGETYLFAGEELSVQNTYQETYTAVNGCDSTVTLTLTVSPSEEELLYVTLCEGESFVLEDATYTTAGIYEYSRLSVSGCDSSIILQLFILPNQLTEEQLTICEGESIQIGPFTYTESGDYWHTLESMVGCDSVIHVELAVVPEFLTNLTDTICEGESIVFNNETLSVSGQYEAEFLSINGCDSLVILDLNILESVSFELEATICHGESYEFGGQELTIQDIYQETYIAANGCDSVVTLDLSVLPNPEITLNEEICEGESYTVGEQVYTESGIYTQTLPTPVANCDSLVVLNLIVIPDLSTILNEQICEGFSVMIGDSTYFSSGIYWNNLTALTGCDSIVQLNLEVLPAIIIEKYETICEGETIVIGDEIYSNTGIYTQAFVSENGCDSTLILDLTVLEQASFMIDATICEGASYQTYTETGIYYDTLYQAAANGCDSIIILNLDVLPQRTFEYSEILCSGETYVFNEETLDSDGIYLDTMLATNGCDSFITLNLKILPEINQYYEHKICDGDSIFIAGTYRFAEEVIKEELTNINGCDSLVETLLLIEPWIDIDGFGGEICVGDSVLIGAVGASNYEWFPAEGLSCTTCPNPIASPEETTIYTVRSQGCLDNIVETQIEVIVHPIPVLSLNENILIPIGQSVHLEAIVENENDIIDIFWSAEDKRFCSGCFDLMVTPSYTVTYTVYITNIYGCQNQLEVTVTVREECIEDDFKVPNMMTPNGDGFNDEFYIQSEIPIELKWLRIYNRWGQLLFETDNINDRWDGTYRRTPLHPGVYAYYMELICPNGEPYKKVGNITIIK